MAWSFAGIGQVMGEAREGWAHARRPAVGGGGVGRGRVWYCGRDGDGGAGLGGEASAGEGSWRGPGVVAMLLELGDKPGPVVDDGSGSARAQSASVACHCRG